MASLDAILVFAATAYGAIIGSFLNVVIHRYPREESIVFPASHCPNCQASIRWYDNVPVLGYLWLLGRCRACRAPISPRYPLVELANALFYLAIYLVTGPTIGFLPIAAIASMTIVLIFIDLEIQILPDVVDLPGIAIGLVIGATNLGALYPDLVLSRTLFESVVGAVAGGGIVLAIALTYQLVRKVEGMGLGDVKMMAMVGAFLGIWGVATTLFLGSIVALLVFGPISALTKRLIPLGIFLAAGAAVSYAWGEPILAWYRSHFLMV